MAFSELVAIYLFLSGTAAGAFALSAVADLVLAVSRARGRRRDPSRHLRRSPFPDAPGRLSTLVYAVSFVMMLAGLLCLLADLGRPETFYLLFVRPSGSVMSLGTFALALLEVCMALAAAQGILTLGPGWAKAASAAKAVGAVLAVVVMVYTGVLLQTAIAVPLWRSGWLWVLFLFSSLSCGSAVVLLCACACEGYGGIHRLRQRVTSADAAFVVLETAAAIAYALTVGDGSAAHPFAALLSGDFAKLFWLGFAGCGILIPLVTEAALLIGRRRLGGPLTGAVAVFVLVGGLCLRLVIVGAGVPAVA